MSAVGVLLGTESMNRTSTLSAFVSIGDANGIVSKRRKTVLDLLITSRIDIGLGGLRWVAGYIDAA